MKRLVLAGGGHAHLFVLEHLVRRPPADIEITLITPSPWQYYSGMLPGWIAGQYSREDCRIDIRPLAERAGARLILEPVAAMNADRNVVCFANGRHLEYDLLSLDTGSEANNNWLASLSDKLLPAKPLDEFMSEWLKIIDNLKFQDSVRLVVVGGGAAGIELALAAKCALSGMTESASVTLVIGRSGLLQGHGKGTQRRVRAALERTGVFIIAERAVGMEYGVYLSSGESVLADRVIAATGARAPGWLGLSRLKLDNLGFVSVDRFHRSLSHPNVFAVGDVSSRSDTSIPRSGVHAVRAGPVLARNLLAAAHGKPLEPYVPRRNSLYILATGLGEAIASWGAFSAEGKWVWRWKDAIDRKFINRFRMDEK